MTVKELMVFFEGFYGEKYSGVFRDTMISYLDGRPPGFYLAAAEVLTKRFSRIYSKAPGPAEFEKHMDEIRAMMPKPEPLPEAAPLEMTDKEREEFFRMSEEFRKNHKGKTGPMAGTLSGVLAFTEMGANMAEIKTEGK